ncbi:MAG: hypothetical protein ISS33_03890 [Candidatus Omnitrophica bacterium]|nr:hypothetical protein [Candidatus Omnitrophota bacterium]
MTKKIKKLKLIPRIFASDLAGFFSKTPSTSFAGHNDYGQSFRFISPLSF